MRRRKPSKAVIQGLNPLGIVVCLFYYFALLGVGVCGLDNGSSSNALKCLPENDRQEILSIVRDARPGSDVVDARLDTTSDGAVALAIVFAPERIDGEDVSRWLYLERGPTEHGESNSFGKVSGQWRAYRGTLNDALVWRDLDGIRTMIFVDAGIDLRSVRNAIALASEQLRPGEVISSIQRDPMALDTHIWVIVSMRASHIIQGLNEKVTAIEEIMSGGGVPSNTPESLKVFGLHTGGSGRVILLPMQAVPSPSPGNQHR